MVPKIVPAPTAVKLRLPRMPPIHFPAASMTTLMTPDRKSMSPMKMNSGTAISGKEATLV